MKDIVPAAWVTQVAEGRVLFMPRFGLNVEGMTGLFTAEQVEAAWNASRAAALEQAARVCDQRAEALSNCAPEDSAECEVLATAIRNLKEQEHG